MSSWLKPLFEPSAIGRSDYERPVRDVRDGLALLLEAQFRRYHAYAEKLRWPRVGEPAPRSLDKGRRLLGALGLHFSGDSRAESEYASLSDAGDPELEVLVAILRSVYLRDLGREREAIAVLEHRLSTSRTALWSMLIGIHLGVRHGEAGRWSDALRATELARAHRKDAEPRAWRNLLANVTESNLAHFRWKDAPSFSPGDRRPRSPQAPVLARVAPMLIGGLSTYLEDDFESRLADPYVHTVRFRSEDPSERQLQGAALRADWLGDWLATAQTRKLLGRYQFLASLTSDIPLSPAAFEHLRRADDYQGMRTAARMVARMGPLAPLQSATRALVKQWSLASCVQASLVLLTEGADSMRERDAIEGLRRLLDGPSFVLSNWGEATRAMAAMLRVVPPSNHEAVANFVIEFLSQDDIGGGLLQGVAEIADNLNWADISAGLQQRWLGLGRRSLDSSAEVRGFGLQLLSAMGREGLAEATRALEDEVARRADLVALAALAQASRTMHGSAKEAAVRALKDALQSTRQQASQGRRSLGGVDAAALAVWLLEEAHDLGDVLVGFLVDPNVGTLSKTGALRLLAEDPGRLPPPATAVLRGALSELPAATDAFSSRESFDAARLQLGASMRAFGGEELLANLMRLMSASPFGRIQAAISIRRLYARLGTGISTILLLGLAGDPQHDVRAAAARALSSVELPEDESLASMAKQRIRELLAEPGSVVPAATLAGLGDASSKGRIAFIEVRSQVQQLSDTHLSSLVRRNARIVLDREGSDSSRIQVEA